MPTRDPIKTLRDWADGRTGIKSASSAMRMRSSRYAFPTTSRFNLDFSSTFPLLHTTYKTLPLSSPSPHRRPQEQQQQEEEDDDDDRIDSLIRSCRSMRALRQIHAHFLASSSSYALSKLVAFCALSPAGDLAYARRLFDRIPHPNIFSWNSIIRGCSLLPAPTKEPLSLYRRLLRCGSPAPNSYTLAFVLKACSAVSVLREGLQVHCHAVLLGLDSSAFVRIGLLTFYAKCEMIADARSLFDGMPDKNLVGWSAMISGYARVGLVNEALGLFRVMQEVGIAPDEVTMVSVISACAKAGALDLGRWVHAFIERKGMEVDLELSTALIDMYAKCGAIEKAKEVFDGMQVRDTMAWSSMIIGLATHGHVKEALQLFSSMLESKVKPNHVTFIGVLSACAHSGVVNDGKRFWATMQFLGVQPTMELYGCMVDLLCRAGHLDEAYSFVTSMPLLPNCVIWRTLLVGCKKDKNFDKADIAAQQLLELEPLNAENYVLLSNLYASRCQWDRVSHMRKKMKDLGVKVVPGCSSTEIDGIVHEFVVGDDSHVEINEIRNVLREIEERVEQAGHEPWTSSVLHDVGENEKESTLCEHSERLAIAYGLYKTKAPVVIRVVKNLRVCADCHAVTKIISQVFDREIIVRDRVRFHRFTGGACSCNDFW